MNRTTINPQDRRASLETKLSKKLPHIGGAVIDLNLAQNRNCEQMIGIAQVPMGIAGPLLLNSDQFGQKELDIPLATTEGALLASINRGLKATRLSGGITSFHENVGASRGPHLKLTNIAQGRQIIAFIDTHWEELKTLAHETESHLALQNWQYQLAGKHLYLRFSFDTAEAMGMNMVTMATQAMLDFISKKFEVTTILSGNACVDKKPAWSTFLSGRGKKVWAETIIAKEIVETVLKTSPQNIVETVQSKQLLGSALHGSLGYNGHFANIVAATYLATGQDLAHIVEGSLGVTSAELDGDKLYFSVYLPSLMVGTVGGGTHLPTQQEALTILGIDKPFTGSASYLAEIIGAVVLAGELSLTAALASNQLACAHQSLGRGKHD
ncbi:hydroxymethylglutaryl-CoA reductase [Candidatus Beckwithbacteria bacterium]|nr:hydroxymethylglutaryl-CoA reductase [Candidatus Beckwithbacteria bacterium]